MLSTTVKYKLGMDIECFNLGNARMMWMDSKESREPVYACMDHVFIDKKKKRYEGAKTPVYNIFNCNDTEKMGMQVINLLKDYAQTDSI
jgi:hypothetical protein